MKHRKPRHLLLLSIIILSGIIISFKIADDGDDFELAKSFDIFHNVVREIRLFYVDDIDASKLINQATVEFLQKLDPYTVYYSESEIEDFDFMTTGAYGGIGASIVEFKDRLLINDIQQNSPADKEGLKIGDVIVSINRISVTEKNAIEIKELIKGEPGSTLTLKIKRYGSDNIIEKNLIREKIQLENISSSELIDDKYAYVQLNQFNQNVGSQLKQKLNDLNSKSKLEGIILDLRSNPGGLLIEAVNVASIFVPKNSLIVSTKGRIAEANHTYKTVAEPIFANIPLVVLINEYSASASEIVAGALQDLDRAVIIGQRSYGKGLVQITRKMNYNTRIKFTTAKYYIPSGRCIQAIDYSHRKEDGSAGHIPDSLVSEFHTVSGRKVFDGGGISPDIIVTADSISSFTSELIGQNIFFDYAGKFKFEDVSIEKPENFSVTLEILDDFLQFIKSYRLQFNSASEKIGKNLLASAQTEKYDEKILEKIKTLQNELKIDTEIALKSNKDEIIPILRSYILKRYYYQKEITKSMFQYDKDIKKALELLKNKQEMKNILSGIND